MVVVARNTLIGAAVVVDRVIGGIVTVGHQEVDLAGVVGMGEVDLVVVLVVVLVVDLVVDDDVDVLVPMGDGVVVGEAVVPLV